MSSCLPCMRLNPEVAAVNDCYPPPKEIIKSAPDYAPLSQDLSKLTYYATNKPSSLAKIGDELERRVLKEARGSTGGYPKSRASLLISLRILHKLITECRRDIGLFAHQAMRMISTAVDVKVYQKNETDLEVAARASACFVAFATYTDGVAIGVDDGLTTTYLGVLGKFAKMATYTPPVEKPDVEEQSRTRLIGLAALNGASSSEGAFSSSTAFPRQVRVIVPALLSLLSDADVHDLKAMSAKLRPGSPSPYLSDMAGGGKRLDRRASLHEHVPGEKGPGNEDVTEAAYRCLYDLVSECTLGQASHVLDVVTAFLDRRGWENVELYCWIAERITAAMLLQTRSIVPVRLVEVLVNLPDDGPPTHKHSTVLAMITAVLSSNTSLVGLPVTDILSNLIAVIVRRVSLDANDALLPALVSCVASLGTHIYYADQINDIVEEIAVQIHALPTTDPARQNILRVLIHCITGVMTAADVGDEAEAEARSIDAGPRGSVQLESKDKGKGPVPDSPAVEIPRRDLGRRNPIAPEVWQETLPLLCEGTYAVRAAYARALIFYLQTELPRDRRPRPDDPNIVRFCNALNAAIYTLAMSSELGAGEVIMSHPPTPTPRDSQHNIDRMTAANGANGVNGRNGSPDPVSHPSPPRGMSSAGVTFNVVEPTPTDTPAGTITAAARAAGVGNGVSGTSTPASGSATPPPKKPMRGGRRVSLPLNRLQSVTTELASFDNVATPFDYAAILKVLDEVHAAVPVGALTTGFPMLLALDRDAAAELIRRPGDARTGAWVVERKRACRETVAYAWRRIAERWGIAPVVDLADRAIHSLPEPFAVPDWLARGINDDVLPPPDEPAAFFRDVTVGESYAATQPLLDPNYLVRAFADAPQVEAGARADAPTLASRFGAPWTVEMAIRDSVERFLPNMNPSEPAPALMAISNASYGSFGRPTSRAVDVSDLRGALAGDPASGSALSSAAQSVVSAASTAPGAGTGTAQAPSPPRAPRTKPDAKEVLQDIFKEGKKRQRNVSGMSGASGQSASTVTPAPGTGTAAVAAS